MSCLLECRDIEKSYTLNGKDGTLLKALDKISFSLYEGDRLGLIGLNGSGKSTLLKIIAGIVKPSSGTVTLYKKVQNLSGFDSMLHPDMTGRENIKFQLKFMHLNGVGAKTAMAEIIAFSELEAFIDEPVKNYSSGMMLRLSFSILKVIKPEILLLDEVLSAGDMIFGKKLDLLLNEYFDSASAIIMASHQLSEISMYCNKCMVLNKGKIEFWGSVSDAVSLYIHKNKQAVNNVLENELVRFDGIELLDKKEFFLYSEPISFNFEYTKKTSTPTDIVVYVNSDFENVLTDCPLYHQNFNNEYSKPGRYKVSVTIPAHLLNKGTYYIKMVFGDGVNDILVLNEILSVAVKPDAWEAEKLWNLNPTHLVRPQFKWNISQLT